MNRVAFEAAMPRWTDTHFSVHFDRVKRAPLSFREECVRAAEELVAEARGLPLFVCVSGGIDGEVVARSMMEVGAAFTPVLFQYKKHRPDDLKNAHHFAKTFGLSLRVIDFDENTFFKGEFLKLAEQHALYEPFVAFDLKRMQMLDGFSVFGAGDIVLERRPGLDPVSFESGSLFQPERLFRAQGGKTCYRFFQSTAELMLSFLRDPIIAKWIEIHDELGMANSRQFKSYMYKSHWPDVVLRKKWTGYERFSGLYLEAQAQLHRQRPRYQDRYDLPLTRLLSELEIQS